ncbi:hypothetical protein SAMN04487936_101414 [Halobacillus dabanensis]|uniref:ABC transport system permease protein n=1 Tax=Halobacillus dabanensis TaxID=240302 RepID=A0A1I3PR71_HALDA|nr:hypothetical protein [Halobacillus dabanensis]SFJ23781.1 hypothetical protein SAMN04487936_101414 [Halobacillus dabanensis]
MILRKSVYRTLKEKKFQYAGVTVLLVLSVMLYVSLSIAISTLEERNSTFSADYKQETFHFVTGEEVTEDQLSSWEKEYDVTLEKRNSTDLTVDGATLRLFTETTEVNIPYISEGELPSQEGEVAHLKYSLKKTDITSETLLLLETLKQRSLGLSTCLIIFTWSSK